MAVIYLEHPKHGQKVACSEDEAKFDEGHGWKRLQLAALLRKAEGAPEAQEAASGASGESGGHSEADSEAAPMSDYGIDELRAMYLAKFGTKPHHKKAADTLRRELMGA